MLALFACIFAITSSAADIPEWTDVITYETGENAIAYKDGFDTTSRVLLSNGDGTYSTYPSNYIIKGTDLEFSNNEIDFTALKKASGKNYTNASIVRFEMPSGFTSVQSSTFRTGSGLKVTSLLTVKIPEGVVSLGDYVFYQNAVITEIELPNSIKTISGVEGFNKTTALKSIKLPAELESIHSKMFQNSGVAFIDMSECTKIKSIGDRAFQYCKNITEITIPEGVESIAECAVYGCTSLTYAYIPSTVTTMGKQVFEGCSVIDTVVCKAQVVGEYTFQNCTTLRVLTLENTKEIGKWAFYKTGIENDLIIPEDCESIGEYAFKQIKSKYVYLPAKLKIVGTCIFENCTGILEVDSNAQVIGTSMFQGCTSIATVNLTGTKRIEDKAFYVGGSYTLPLASITLPDGLEYIGEYAFIRSSLESVVIPASVTSFGGAPFYSCKSLKKVVFLCNVTAASMFEGCSAMTEVVLPSTLTAIAEKTFNGVSSSKFTIYYTGTDYERVKELGGSSGGGYSRFTDAKYYTYEDYIENGYTNKYMFIYGCNLCTVAFGGNHTVDEERSNDCAGICKYCALSTPKDNPQHSITVTYAYANGYATVGTKTECCSNEGCPLKAQANVSEIPAIFDGFMYATREESDSRCGMVMTYGVNIEALENYQDNTGKLVSYGVLAVAKANASDNILNADGTSSAQSIVSANVTGTPSVDLIIWGSKNAWETEMDGVAVKDIPFYIVGYASYNGAVSYFCGETSSGKLSDLTSKSYSEIKA